MSTYYRNRRVLFCENLESRELLTVSAALNGAQLDISMDANDTAFVRFDGTNYIVANTSNGTALSITGGPATTANTTAIHVSGTAIGTQAVVFEGSNPFSLTGALTVDSDVETAVVNQALAFGSINVSANSIIDVNAALTATAGNITVNGGATGTAYIDAALTASADVEVMSGGFLAIGGAINASGNTVRLVANGSISQTAIITAANVSARSVTGTVALQLNNLITGTVAAASHINVWVHDAANAQLTVGTVAAGSAGFTAVTGFTSVGYSLITAAAALTVSSPVVASGSGDVNLRAGTTLALNSVVSTAGTTVRLAAGTGISQTAIISTHDLSAVTTSGTINLGADNLVSATFAAQDANGNVVLRNKETVGHTLIVGAVVGTGSGFAGVVGVSATTGDISLVLPSESLLIRNVVTVDAAHVVRLLVGANVNQTVTGRIIAGSLLVNAVGSVNLATDNSDATKLVANLVQKLAIRTTGAGSNIRFYTDGSVDITSILGNNLIAGVAGVTTAAVSNSLVSGAISIRSKDTMTIHSNIRTGNVTSNIGNAISGTVRLQSGANIITSSGANVGTGNATVTNLPGRTSQVGSIGLIAVGSIHGDDSADAFALFVGQASGAMQSSSNKFGQLAVQATGTTKVHNSGPGTIHLGAVGSDSVVFTPGISGGNIDIT